MSSDSQKQAERERKKHVKVGMLVKTSQESEKKGSGTIFRKFGKGGFRSRCLLCSNMASRAILVVETHKVIVNQIIANDLHS